MSASTRCTSASPRRIGGDLPAAIHADDDVGHAEHLLDVGRRHDQASTRDRRTAGSGDRFPPARRRRRRGSARSSAARRARRRRRAAERELLLVAAAQLVGQRAQPARGRRRPRRRACARSLAAPPARGCRRSHESPSRVATRLSSTLKRRNMPSPGAILRDELHLALERTRGRAEAAAARPCTTIAPVASCDKTGERAHHLDRAGADLAGDADDLAALGTLMSKSLDRRHAQVLDHQHRLAGGLRRLGIHLDEAAARASSRSACSRSRPVTGRVPTSSPLRSTVTVSQIWNTSPSRWVM